MLSTSRNIIQWLGAYDVTAVCSATVVSLSWAVAAMCPCSRCWRLIWAAGLELYIFGYIDKFMDW